MPEDYSYHVCCFESLGDSNSFRTHLKLRLTREDEVQKWQEDFQASSGLTWRKSKTYPDTGDGSNKYRVSANAGYRFWLVLGLVLITQIPRPLMSSSGVLRSTKVAASAKGFVFFVFCTMLVTSCVVRFLSRFANEANVANNNND